MNNKTKYRNAIIKFIHEQKIYDYAFLVTNLAYLDEQQNTIDIIDIPFEDIHEAAAIVIDEKDFFIDFLERKKAIASYTWNPRQYNH